jgi:hypothetical protein
VADDEVVKNNMQLSDLKHGQRVKCIIHGTHIDDAMISIDENNLVYICQNKKDGSAADDRLGYKYSWRIYNPGRSEPFSQQVQEEGVSCLEIIKEQNNKPMNLIEFFRNATATADEKLLKKHGVEDPIGTPTEEGLRLSAEIQYRKNRAEIIEIVKKLEEEAK